MSADPVAVLEARAQRAEDLWRGGEFAAALQEYTAALRERLPGSGYGAGEAVTLTAADMVVAERVSDLAVLFGHAEAAADLLAGVAARVEQSGNVFWADYVLTKRIHLALGRGLVREASDILARMKPRIGDVSEIAISPAGLARWESGCRWPRTDRNDRTVIFALLCLCMGQILSALGQYADAVSLFERGLSHADDDGAPDLARRVALPLKLSLAAALLEKGALPESEAQLAAVEPALEPTRQPSRFVRWLELGGKLRLLTGDFGAALDKFRSSLTFCEKYHFEKAALAASVNLAHALVYFNQTAEATKILEGALAQALAAHDRAAAARAAALLSVARARGASLADTVSVAPTVTEHWGLSVEGEAAEVAATADEDSLNLPRPDNHLAFFEDRALEFYWLLGRRALRAAALHLAGMKERFRLSDSFLIRERLRVLDSVMAYYQGDYRRAEVLLIRALPSVRELGLKPELWQAQRLLGWCMAKLGRPQAACDALAGETSELLDTITDSLPHEERAVFLLNKWTAEEEYIAGEFNKLARLKVEFASASWWRKLSLRWILWRRLDALMTYVDRYKHEVARREVKGEKTAAALSASAASLSRRLLRHPRREATISFLVLPDRLLIMRAGWFSLDFGVSAAARPQVRELVRRWHASVSRFIEGSRGLGALPAPSTPSARTPLLESAASESRDVADELAATLQLPPLLDGLPGAVRSLRIVPDDSLHGFPFAAIRYNGCYLIEKFALSYAFENGPASRAPEGNGGEALAFGVSKGTQKFDPLPCVKDELDVVEGWLKRRRITGRHLDDTGEQACEPDRAALLKLLPEMAFAHVACHGVFRPDLPDHSGIVLPSQGRDEVLSVRDLSMLNLKGLKHITLSSCWSADHFVLPGRWVISLPETLWRAGAGSVLGCLWLVSDRVGVDFMAQFYEYTNSLSRQEALRRTQLDFLNGRLKNTEGLDTTHQFYWAGYQLFGESSRLRL